MNRVCVVAVLSLLAVAACGGDELSANSSCEDYVNAAREDQTAAVQQVAQDQQAVYSPLVQANVDAKCSVAPDRSISWAITGQSSAETAVETNDQESAPEPEPLTLDSSCEDYAAAPADEQDAFANRVVERRKLYGRSENVIDEFEFYDDEPGVRAGIAERLSEYLNTACGGTSADSLDLRTAARQYGVPVRDTDSF
jgi:hypothetical protein